MNIQTASFKIGVKPKKEYICEIIENMYEDAITDAEKLELAAIYKYFTPTQPAKSKTVEQWVFKAVSKEESRPYLHLSYSDGSTLTATDGHRLHQTTTELPEGFYNSEGVKIENLDFNFLAVERIIKDKSFATYIEDIQISELTVKKSKKTKGLFFYTIDGVKYNKRFVDDCANGQNVVKIYRFDVQDPLRIETQNGFALVMPLNQTA